MNAVHDDARVYVPAGLVPSLREFTRQVWRYRDSNGQSVLCPPPDVFTLVLDDAGDAACVQIAFIALTDALEFDGRVETRWVAGSQRVIFHDLEALHTFVRALASQGGKDRAASDVAAFILGSLGFRWG